MVKRKFLWNDSFINARAFGVRVVYNQVSFPWWTLLGNVTEAANMQVRRGGRKGPATLPRKIKFRVALIIVPETSTRLCADKKDMKRYVKATVRVLL